MTVLIKILGKPSKSSGDILLQTTNGTGNIGTKILYPLVDVEVGPKW